MEDGNSCNPFLSVRTQGCELKTRATGQNTNPNFLAKLYFPVYLQTYNDKITIRLEHSGNTNTFLANLPEFPNGHDFANISKLLSLDGKMHPTWVNLYGVAPKERNNSKKGVF